MLLKEFWTEFLHHLFHFMVPSFQELRKQAKRKEKLIKVACEKRKEEESGLGGDEGILLSQLVSGEISEEEVIDNVVLLVFAAHDTASFSVAVTFKMPAEHPDCHSLLLQGTLCFQNFRLQRKFPKSEGHP